MKCRRCRNRPATQDVCVQIMTDIDWVDWCDDCVDERIREMTTKYTSGEWSLEDFEAGIDFFLLGPKPRVKGEPTYAVRYDR